ncbi:hypothetical protein [Streptomyces pseudovenezuelae]|uniref:hypothetical protein n=1 Tax=Streptomyces pseudovenezuelae TaxID=67350 RepID=UPI002E81062E|nr:hypothetical protein [Streptomyces pseudovenezuelae]WUA93707.1 hypothetical protein OHO81_43060 [Streptomyces pseudovenezuelae]
MARVARKMSAAAAVEGGLQAEEEHGGSGGELGEREREVGAEVVVGVDAGKAVLGDLLVEGRVPRDACLFAADACHEVGHAQQPGARG